MNFLTNFGNLFPLEALGMSLKYNPGPVFGKFIDHSNFDDDELLDLIKFSQKRVSEESLSNLHERILKVI